MLRLIEEGLFVIPTDREKSYTSYWLNSALGRRAYKFSPRVFALPTRLVEITLRGIQSKEINSYIPAQPPGMVAAAPVKVMLQVLCQGITVYSISLVGVIIV